MADAWGGPHSLFALRLLRFLTQDASIDGTESMYSMIQKGAGTKHHKSTKKSNQSINQQSSHAETVTSPWSRDRDRTGAPKKGQSTGRKSQRQSRAERSTVSSIGLQVDRIDRWRKSSLARISRSIVVVEKHG